MMHQFNNGKIVISITGDLHFEGLVFKEKFRNIYIYDISTFDMVIMQIGRENCIQYLDDFLIILPTDYALQSVLWEDFYICFGDYYESMIDVRNNIKCIDTLYSYLQKKIVISSSTKILDYGCGTGLSIGMNVDCNLLGYEPNKKMREQAVEKGMQVLDYQHLYSLSDACIDAIFSSYVFHMGIKECDIEVLSRIIRCEGVIVANFYKNINCLRVNDFFVRHGFFVNKVNELDERFGCVYEYRKK